MDTLILIALVRWQINEAGFGSMNFSLSGEFWAAIGGAVVGGAISAIIQWLSVHHQAKLEREKELNRQRTLAYSLIFKLNGLHSDLHGIAEHLKEAEALPHLGTAAREPWQYVQPLSNIPRSIHFNGEEVSLLFGTSASDAVNDILDLERIHDTALQVLQEYKALWQQVTNALPNSGFSGNVGSTEMTEPHRDCRRLFGLSHAATGSLSCIA